MDPLNMPLVWRRNAPEPETFTLLGDDGVTPVDLTGIGFAFQVRLYPGAPGAPLLSLGLATEGSPGFYLDAAAAGQFTLTPPPPLVLQALPAPPDLTTGRLTGLSYDCLLVHPGFVLEPFWEGTLTLDSGTTIYGV